MSSRIQFIISRLQILQQRIQEHDPFDRPELAEEEQDFINKWEELMTAGNQALPDFLFDAQELLSRFIRCYPNLVPLMHRELLYFIGGECLHFLGDEELAYYQQIDEQLYDAEQAGESIDIGKMIECNRSAAQGETLQ